MSAPRATGWKKQPDDERDHDALKVILRVVPSVPEKASNEDLGKEDLDQGALGSCTSNGSGQTVRAAQILEQVEKTRLLWIAAGNDEATFDAVAALAEAQATTPFWSRLMMYFLARAYEGTTGRDNGANIRDIYKAANKFGFCAESVWAYNDNADPTAGPTPYKDTPPAEAFRQAYDQRQSAENVKEKVIDYALIRETGYARVDAVKLAISQRHLVTYGTLVTNRFCSDMSANDGKPIDPPTNMQDIAGGHCMALDAYDPDGVESLNSWSKKYGRNGHCKLSWDYVAWSETSDLWVVRRAPLLAKVG